MVVLSINAVGGFAESVAGRFVCESLAVGVDPEVEGLPRNGIKVAEELNAFAFCTKVADEADLYYFEPTFTLNGIPTFSIGCQASVIRYGGGGRQKLD